MNLHEFFNNLDIVEAPKKFPQGVYTHQVKALTVMPTQDETMYADAGELPKKFNVTQMKIGIYDEEDDSDPYSYGNTGLEVFHNAGTWQLYTDDVTRVQIADYLGIANKDIDFSEQGMQNEKFMHFDISDEAVAQLIDKGAFKMTKGVKEDDPTSTKLDSEEIKQKALLYMMRQHTYQKDRRQYDADNSGNADKFYTEQDIENLEAMIAHLKDGASLDPALQDELAKVLRDAKVKDRTGRFAMRKMDLAKKYQDQLRKYKPLEMGEDINDIVRLSGIK